MKKVIAACIDQILEFDTREEMNEFVEKLENGSQECNIANEEIIDGKIRIRVQKQYNSSPMLISGSAIIPDEAMLENIHEVHLRSDIKEMRNSIFDNKDFMSRLESMTIPHDQIQLLTNEEK